MTCFQKCNDDGMNCEKVCHDLLVEDNHVKRSVLRSEIEGQ